MDAFEIGREFAKVEGLLFGISSDVAVGQRYKLQPRLEYACKNIVILPETGERYN